MDHSENLHFKRSRNANILWLQQKDSNTGENSIVSQDWEHLFQPGGPTKIGPGYYVADRDLDKKGNVVAFGPIAQEYSEIEALLLVILAAKFMKAPGGMKDLRDIIKTYLTQAGNVVSSLQKSSASNVYTAVINQYVSTKIYARLGLMTSFDALQTEVWLDHIIGEMLKRDYVQQAMAGLTTLVDASRYGETEKGEVSYAGLATLAKVLGK